MNPSIYTFLAYKFPMLEIAYTTMPNHRDYYAALDFKSGIMYINRAATPDAKICQLCV